MARGETKVGYAPLQNPGSTAAARTRGGEIIPRRISVEAVISGAQAATATNYGVFYTAVPITRNLEPDEVTNGKVEWEVTAVYERHAAAGTDAGAVTLQLTKCASGTAAAAGSAVLATQFNLKGTADTNQKADNTGGLSATLANLQLMGGDSLALVTTGVLTALSNVSVTVELRRVG